MTEEKTKQNSKYLLEFGRDSWQDLPGHLPVKQRKLTAYGKILILAFWTATHLSGLSYGFMVTDVLWREPPKRTLKSL